MLKRVTLCALIVTFFAGCLVAAAPPPAKPGPQAKPDPKLVAAYQKALAAHKAGKLDEALADYKEVLKLNKNIPDVYLNMAQIYLKKKDFNSAIPLLLKVEQLEPKNGEVAAQLVRIYMFNKQMDKALAQAKIAARLKSKDPIAYLAIGQDNMQKKDYAAAAKNLGKWIAATPQDMGTRNSLAYAYMQTKQYALALAQYQKLIAANPNDLQVRQMAALAAQKANNPEAAIKQFEAINKKNPNDPVAAVALAEQYMRQGGDAKQMAANLKKAKALFEKAQMRIPKADPKYYEVIFDLGIIAFMQDPPDFKAAKARFAEASSLRPKDINSKVNLGLAEAQLALKDPKEYDNALKHFQAALALDPKNPKAMGAIIDIYRQKKDFDKARAMLEKIQALNPKDPSPSIEIAGIYIEEGKMDDAQKLLEDINKKYPKNPRAMLALADIYRRGDKMEDAVKVLEALQALPALKGDVTPTKMIAEIYMQEYRTDKAREAYDSIIRKNPRDQDALKGKAYSYEREGDPSAGKALGAWQQYRAAYPDDPLSYLRIAALYQTQKNTAAAVRELKDGMAKWPKDRQLVEQLAIVQRDAKQYDEAIATWRDIEKNFPEDKKVPQDMQGPTSSPVDQIADILAEQKKYDEARAQYKPMIDKDPKDTTGYKGMARIYVKEQMYDEAIAQWNKVKELTADSKDDREREDAYSQIANIYKSEAVSAKDADKAAFYDKAASEFKSLLAKDPKSRMGMLSLAGVYYNAKKFDEAIAELRAVGAAYPADVKMMGITDQIARVLTEQGKYDEAIDEYVQILKNDPKDEGALAGLTREYTEKKDPEPQITAWRKVIEISAGKTDVQVDLHNQIASSYMQQEKEELAGKEYADIIKLKPDDWRTMLTLARLYEKAQKREEAMELYRSAGKFNSTWFVDSARMLEAMGKVDEAKAELAGAIKADPKNSRPHSALGRMYETEGKDDQAVAEYRTAIKLDKSNYEATANLMRIMQKQGKFDEAAALQKQLLATHPELVNSTDYARSLENAGKIDEAAAEYERQIVKQPKLAVGLRAELGSMLLRHDRYAAALKVYAEMAKDKEQNIRVDGIRGAADTHAKMGKADLAISEYKQVLKVYPSYPQVIDQLEKLYAAQGKQGEFLLYMKQLVASSENSSPYDFMMEKFKAAGKADEGLTFLNTLMTQRPADPNLKVSVAKWTADAGQIDKAIDIYQKFLAGATQDPGPGVHISLADLLAQSGKTDQAIEEYKKVIDQSGSPEVRFKYAALLEKANLKPDAVVQYQKILQMDPANQEALKLMRAIDPNAKIPEPPPPGPHGMMPGGPGGPGGPGMPGR